MTNPPKIPTSWNESGGGGIRTLERLRVAGFRPSTGCALEDRNRQFADEALGWRIRCVAVSHVPDAGFPTLSAFCPCRGPGRFEAIARSASRAGRSDCRLDRSRATDERWTRRTTISPRTTCGCWSGSTRTRTGSLVVAAQSLGLDVAEVEGLCSDLVDVGMIERSRVE